MQVIIIAVEKMRSKQNCSLNSIIYYVKRKPWFIVQLVLLFFVISNSYLHHIGLINALMFYVVQLLFFYIPGRAFTEIVLKSKTSSIKRYFFSYIFGITVAFGIYSISMLIKIRCLFYIIMICNIVLSIYILYKRRNQNEDEKDYFGWKIVTLFSTILQMICTVTVGLMNVWPTEEKGASFYCDFLYWVGNNIEMSYELPPTNFRLVGENLKYHFFSSIVVAIESIFPNQDIRKISFYLQYLVVALLLSLGVYLLLQTFITKKQLLVMGMIIILLTEGYSVTYVWHMYFCPFGYDYGVIFGIASFLWLKHYCESNKRLDFIISLFMIFMMTGMKGPIALIIMMSYGLTSLRFMINGDIKKGLRTGIVWLMVFLITYILVIKGEIATGDKGLHYVGIVDGFKNNPWALEIYYKLLNYTKLNRHVIAILSLIFYTFRVNLSSMTLVTIASLIMLYNMIVHKEQEKQIIDPICMTMFGCLLTLLTHQQGSSEMYFVMATIPFATLAGLIVLNNINRKSVLLYALYIVILMTIGCGTSIFWKSFVIPKGRDAVNAYLYGSQDYYNYYPISAEEYLACTWLADNCKNGTKIALDNTFTKERMRGMVFGVFSQQYIWNDGSVLSNQQETARRQDLLERYLAGEDVQQELQTEGVEYIMVQASKEHLFDRNETIVYENKEIAIVSIR